MSSTTTNNDSDGRNRQQLLERNNPPYYGSTHHLSNVSPRHEQLSAPSITTSPSSPHDASATRFVASTPETTAPVRPPYYNGLPYYPPGLEEPAYLSPNKQRRESDPFFVNDGSSDDQSDPNQANLSGDADQCRAVSSAEMAEWSRRRTEELLDAILARPQPSHKRKRGDPSRPATPNQMSPQYPLNTILTSRGMAPLQLPGSDQIFSPRHTEEARVGNWPGFSNAAGSSAGPSPTTAYTFAFTHQPLVESWHAHPPPPARDGGGTLQQGNGGESLLRWRQPMSSADLEAGGLGDQVGTSLAPSWDDYQLTRAETSQAEARPTGEVIGDAEGGKAPSRAFAQSLVDHPLQFESIVAQDSRLYRASIRQPPQINPILTGEPAPSSSQAPSPSDTSRPVKKRKRRHEAPLIANVYSNHGILDKHADWIVGERALQWFCEYDAREFAENTGDTTRIGLQKVTRIKRRALEDRAAERGITVKAAREGFEAEVEQFRFDKRVREIGLADATRERNTYFYGFDWQTRTNNRPNGAGMARWLKMMSSKYGTSEAERASQRIFDERRMSSEVKVAHRLRRVSAREVDETGARRKNSRKASGELRLPSLSPRRESQKSVVPDNITSNPRTTSNAGRPSLPSIEALDLRKPSTSTVQESRVPPPTGYEHASTCGYETPEARYRREQARTEATEELQQLESEMFGQLSSWNQAHDESGEQYRY
ncbi:hypothetical protein BDZ85DRAFT_249764 [Elsinoe ampelina]|uniref:Uncharacterized protein n=1 Tax=Elsinoe ampelina TaxID=302913 RepID=A0A6A6GAR2_9PEZI|nr:hypothetical protein BDZ85DRAFT_249764 [Elsinoe ampelina]